MGSGTGTPVTYTAPSAFARLYCTLNQVIDDLDLLGVKNEEKALSFIRAASRFIDKRGRFIPVSETRRYDGSGKVRQWIDPLITLDTISHDGTTLTSSEYVLYPRTRHWDNGPYTSLELATGGRWTREEDAVVISGVWGLYYEVRAPYSVTLGASQLIGAATVTLSDGRYSPGAVLLVGSEQMLIEATDSPSDSSVTASAIDNSQTAITVSVAGGFEIGETIRVDVEQMRILDVNSTSNQLVVARGYNGSTIAAHSGSAAVYVYRTFMVARGINGTTAAAHNSGVSVAQVVPPDDVNYLCRQMAALILKKAQSGYQGKVGNVELGETFYFNEFPDDPLKRIMANYRIVTV
jgi:hypothetical protein